MTAETTPTNETEVVNKAGSDESMLAPKNTPVVRTRTPSYIAAASQHPHQFLSDEEIGTSIFFRVMTFLYYTVALWFHNHTTHGMEKIPKDSGALLIGRHTTHNQDIFLGLTTLYAVTGRAMRGLLHRIVFKVYPWVAYMGLVPGERGTAVQLLKHGFIVGVLPGGGEEAMYGHEHACDLHPRWGDRTGFAVVARDSSVPIIPMFVRNAEEMRFNPIFYILNLIGFTRFYDVLTTYFLSNKNTKLIGWILKQLGLYSWFMLSWVAIPVPVKTTGYVGDPLYFKNDDDLHYITKTCRNALQALIDEHQPHKHNYMVGLKERFGLYHADDDKINKEKNVKKTQ